MIRASLFVIPIMLFAQPSDAPPDAAQQMAIVSMMREAALNYAGRLEDFLCTQLMKRSVDTSGSEKHYKLLETQELELGYVAHTEHYRLRSVNGKTTDLAKRVRKQYWIPGGEFGSALQGIFDPKAAATFEWDHEEPAAGMRSCVFRYRIPATSSTYEIQADQDRVKMAHHG